MIRTFPKLSIPSNVGEFARIFHSFAGIVTWMIYGKLHASSTKYRNTNEQKNKHHIMKLVPSILFATILSSSASVVITYAEDPNSYNSSLSGTSVLDFNNMKTGRATNVSWDGVGTFDALHIYPTDVYGGAPDSANPKGSKYSVQGAGSRLLSTSLMLEKPSAYFGMWWSAGDSRNVLSFYNGTDLVAQFTTKSLMEPLPAEYDGNPLNRKLNSGEPYAFINFYGDQKTAWDRIIFSNDGTSGFESDNFTTRVEAWDPAKDGAIGGVVVAEVSGKTTTLVTTKDLVNTRWSLDETTVAKAPGAPVPPWMLLGAFGVVAVLRQARRNGKVVA